MTSMSDDERVLREFFDRIWNAGDESAVDALFDPTFRHHDLVTYAETDLAGFLDSIRRLRGAFSQLDFRVHDAVAGDGRVATRWEAVGTSREHGRTVGVDGMSFDHVRDGRIVENWTVWDRGGLARQLSDES
jgi:predicted ester cyclase